MEPLKLKKIHKITAKLKCVTGLHIGGGDAEMHIGGVDNQIIRNPVDGKPYIPGSSLKGKIRSLMEWRTGVVTGEPLGMQDLDHATELGEENAKPVQEVIKLFGVGGNVQPDDDKMKKIGSARLSFWDCPINEDWEKSIQDKDLLLVEIKTENAIDRIGGTAKNPRQTERVPAGAIFDFNLTVRELNLDEEEELIDGVLKGLKLLEMDALGGSGSRGYGKVKFEDLKVDGLNYQKTFDGIDPFK